MAVRKLNPDLAYGIGDALIPLAPLPIIAKRDPSTNDIAQLGTTWVNESTGAVWILAQVATNSANWVTSPVIGGVGVFTSLEVTSGSLTIDLAAGGIDVGAGNFTVDNAGNVVVLGNLSVSGTFTFTGDLNLTSAAAVDITSTLNAAPSIALTANGGANEQIYLHSIQGTSVSAIKLTADVGGVLIQGGLATINAVKLQATNVAGGVNIAGGTAGITLAATNGAIALTSGTGAISVGADAVAHTVTVGNITGATAVNVNTGTGGFNVVTTGAGDVVVASSDTMLLDSAGVLELNSSAGVISIGNDAVSQNINIGTAGARVVTVGNSTGATSIVLNAGTAGVGVGTNAIAHTVTLGNNTGASVVAINGGTAAAGAINIGTTANDVPITLGNSTGATALLLNAGTGGVGVGTNAIAHTVTIGNGTGVSSVVVNSGTGAASFGANATDHTTTVGSVTVASPTVIQGGTSGITLTAPFVALPGPVYIYTGAGAPGNGLALHVGDMYINTTAASAVTRLYIATAASTWTNVTCAA